MQMGIINRIVNNVMGNPFLYHYMRAFLQGGIPYRSVIDSLDTNQSDLILDIGCGSSYIAQKIKFRKYLGIDIDPKSINAAIKKNIPNTEFLVADINTYDFSKQRFDKAILYGVLHHLNDEEAVTLLNKLSTLIGDCVVTWDSVYLSNFYVTNNLMCALDRGKHVRTAQEMTALIKKSNLTIVENRIVPCRSRLSKYILFKLAPG
ncbi:MAG: hypothetical protein A3G33_03235 [Omnitrophica bacterium RIFCSPLOWO2_12_FULL_44_17]|uniref:Methyltransferase domain-containing protein n=1 Tax=Candidatus Danuiimicrobium aquiferis TaxID=1801832 RepID=A0A1G1KTQ3_9BACT|nr:MAG: hypothetical protein A3B72_06780 [Omnitrophica bacterium RIFCSPHIGHO2_02_FULL_45_28]OGW88534.1 MAG: hypothetical protein A3E74_02030 [Omnitrophica bacterium RIFCSPHIGHO2_12_FULL_44_12]OGW96333.1 MAG: hypothetical protein A3G33_03235 [Omnitrophica bacterium RIFCSPLOWO2_12_FULL_44_17]OGX04859.1 MAG: hypothetical protein A3J12_07900 [Omnitrophica bacterium RIFCSPLOWO2_02_FULL_44_11]